MSKLNNLSLSLSPGSRPSEQLKTAGSNFCIYLPPANEVWGKVVFLHLFVILFTEGGSASVHAGIPPRDQAPPGTDTPSGAATLTQEQTPPTRHPPPEQTHTPRSKACWEIRSTSGRYASYWNAILLVSTIKMDLHFRFYRIYVNPKETGFERFIRQSGEKFEERRALEEVIRKRRLIVEAEREMKRREAQGPKS